MPKVELDSRLGFKKWVLKLLAIVLFTFLAPLAANAQFVYNDCYTASDFGKMKQNRFVIRPIGEICFQRCEAECNAFSRRSGGIELNQGTIDKCNVACRAGSIFSSKVQEVKPGQSSSNVPVMSEEVFKTASFCATGNTSIASAGFNEYNTKIRVAPKQVVQENKITNPLDSNTTKAVTTGGVRIKIMYPGGGASNAIYMCGSTTISLQPRPAFLRNAGWASSQYDRNAWNARNNRYYDTGVDIKDGDYVSISYGGQYRACGAPQCPFQPLDKGLFIKKPREISTAIVAPGSALVLPGKDLLSLAIKIDPNKSIDQGGLTYDNPDSMLAHNAGISFLGLQARTWENKTVFDTGVDFKGQDSAFNGDTTVFSRDTFYSFSGILKGFSTRFATLAIGHPDERNTWGQHLGGYNVSVTRKGCQFLNGQRLQYAIAPIDKGSDQKNPAFFPPTQWYDVTEAHLLKYEDIAVPVEGLLYLRIKPLTYDKSVTPDCQLNDARCVDSIRRIEPLYKPENTSGQYYVLVEQDDVSAAADIIGKVVKVIRGYLFGSGDAKGGIVQYLFNRFVADSALVTTIRALLLFYIVYTGFSFIVGIAQFTQKEGMTRLIKIGIVLALISPDSWRFFNEYLFKLFTDGALELLILLTAPPETSESQMAELLKNPTQIFGVFNEPFRMLFGSVTWTKIIALLFSGPIGIIIAFVIMVAAVIYAICIAKALLLYLISLIGIATLLLMAPIFVSFVLFQFTKQMFDSWLKQLMSFAFQPIMVYVFIVVINYLILASLQVVLGFTACRACWFSLSIPGLDTTCLIPGYVSLFGVHNPDGIIGMPMSSIAAAFYFLILAQAMYAFTSFGAQLANMLVMSSFAGLDLSGTVGKVINDTRSIASTIVGVDRDSIEGSKALRGRVEYVGDKYEKAKETIFGKKKDNPDEKKK